MKNKNFWLYAIIILTVLFIASSVIFRVFQLEILPSQFFGALIGVVITAIITVLLLQGQTASEEKREKNVKVFEKKQEVYHEFLDKLKAIIQDGQITIASQEKEGNVDNNVDELKDLLFELGYLKMHTSKENIKEIFALLGKIIQVMDNFSSDGIRKQENISDFYTQLAKYLFNIVDILKSDLYHTTRETIEKEEKEEINNILRACNLYIQSNEFDIHELQNYFWNELQKQLQSKGYPIQPIDFQDNINKYYGKKRNRHRWYGFQFNVYQFENKEPVLFRIEIGNSYYYGFPKIDKKNNTKIVRYLESLHFIESDYWYGWKNSEKYNIDFWKPNINTDAFKRLKDHRKREDLIKDIADEMDRYIQKYIEVIKKENL